MNKHIGSTLESLFDELGERVEFEALTIKKIIAERVRRKMEAKGYNNAALAKAMHATRTQVQRLVDPKNTSLTLDTLAKAALALDLKIDLVPKRGASAAKKPTKVVAKAAKHVAHKGRGYSSAARAAHTR